MEPLHLKYRPNDFDQVVGQDATVRSLLEAVKKQAGHTFLFTGPSGVGKTTLARLTAHEFDCDLIEIDAATHTGIDDMRAVTSNLQYRPLGEGAAKGVIIDECHMLSKSAWNSLLKILEEPPDWVYWFLCTTEPVKVPASVKTRCLAYELKPVPSTVLRELLEDIVVAEGLTDCDDKVLRLCAKEAGGSARQALINLAICAGGELSEDARELLRSAEQNSEAVELARLLVKGASWNQVQELLVQLGDISPESVRHIVRGYVTRVVLSAKSDDKAGRSLEILDAFSEPFHPSDGITPVVLACGRVLLS